ncbi:MAG: hypothetical protein ACTSWQ_08635 [Candidatus Thorarchaeota archaeon]
MHDLQIQSLEKILSGRGESDRKLWVFADDVIDYIGRVTTETDGFTVEDGKLRVPTNQFLVNYQGQDVMMIDGSSIRSNGDQSTLLSGGEKYDTVDTLTLSDEDRASISAGSMPRIYVEQVQLGGGGFNMMRVMSQHSKELTKLYTSLHVQPKELPHSGRKTGLETALRDYKASPKTPNDFNVWLDDVEKYMQAHEMELTLMGMGVGGRLIYVSSEGNSEGRSLVLYEVEEEGVPVITDKIILRGTKIQNPQVLRTNTEGETDVGTIVINSITSPFVFDEAVSQYQAISKTYGQTLGLICITEKMEDFYERIATDLLPNGFIAVMNEVEALRYGNPGMKKDRYAAGVMQDDLFESLKTVWNQQGDNHSRIYVTLGEFGCIGVEEDGNVYRLAGIELTSDELNTNGAGDTFLSMVARLEHERAHEDRDPSVMDVMAMASGAASYFIENQNYGRTVTESNVKTYLANHQLRGEYIGQIGGCRLGIGGKLCQLPIGTEPYHNIGEMSDQPVQYTLEGI